MQGSAPLSPRAPPNREPSRHWVTLVSPSARHSRQTTCTTPIGLAMTPRRPTALHGLTACLARARRPPTAACRLAHPWGSPAQCFSTCTPARKKLDFTQRPDDAAASDEKNTPPKAAATKSSRKNASKTSSLRSIAVEAQRSRTFVKSRGRQRFVDPDAKTKVGLPIQLARPLPQQLG